MIRQLFRSLRRQQTRCFWGITLSAFLLRVMLLLLPGEVTNSPLAFSVDASSYHEIAFNLVERQIFASSVDPPYNITQPDTFRPPLTPFFLAGWYSIFGPDLFWGQIGLALFSALSCGLTYRFGCKLVDPFCGALAGIVSMFYPLLLLLVVIPLTEGLSIFLSLALLCLLTHFEACHIQVNSTTLYWRRLLAVGVVFGLALLNKASNIVLLPCIVVWALFSLAGSWKIRLQRLAIILLISATILLPWALRNYRIVGSLTPVNTNGGWTFYLGNNAQTEKNLSALESGATNGWVPPQAVFAPFADLAFHETKRYEQRAIRLGIAFIREHPAQAVNFAWRKLKIFWSPYPHLLDRLTWYPLAIFGVIGGLLSLRAWKKHLFVYLFMLSSMSIPLVFTSMPRFRAPLMPFIIIFAANGLLQALKTLGALRRRV